MAYLKALPDPVPRAESDASQRFLTSAVDAVEAVLDNLETIRQLRKDETGDIRGRLTANEEDLLRAAVVFTGAGLDATLKRLIRDALPGLLVANQQAHDKFEGFVAEHLGTGEITDTKMVAKYLTSANPREKLIEAYIYELTGSSLQSAEEVGRVAGALGINDEGLRKEIVGLKPLFVARNEISHELDLQSLEKPGDRTRRTRSMTPTKNICYEGFKVGQLIVNDVGNQMSG
jgi:hypothetical protein